MTKMFVNEFCNRYGIIPRNKRTRLRYAIIKTIDDRGRLQDSFTVSRNCLPKDVKLGDRISFINITQEGDKQDVSSR